jgi:uncharacterized protein YdhG (YjbR/CyaY superfamily)
MEKKYNSINAYIDEFPDETKKKLYELKECILTVVPNAKELFTYGVPAFALIEGGKMKEQIMIAGFKKHVGFYPHPTTIEFFDKELSIYKRGKGSVQFPLDKELPRDLIVDMVRYRLKLINKV